MWPVGKPLVAIRGKVRHIDENLLDHLKIMQRKHGDPT